jgi:hypothetical protein
MGGGIFKIPVGSMRGFEFNTVKKIPHPLKGGDVRQDRGGGD